MRPTSTLVLAVALAAAACSDGGAPDDAPVPTVWRNDHASLMLDDGATATLTGPVLDQHGQPMPGRRPAFRSLDTTVVTVDAAGLVVARRPGLTDVVGTVGDSSVAVHVFVRRVAATLAIATGNGQAGIASLALGDPIVVRVTDRHGNGVEAVTVRMGTGDGAFSPEWITTDASGTATTTWTLGATEGTQRATAHVDGLAPVALTATAAVVPAPVLAMLQRLDTEIASAIAALVEMRPRNPGLVAHIDAKLAMLRDPGLRGAILRDRRWVTGSVRSTSAQDLALVAVFPLEAMRGEAQESLGEIARAMTYLEHFMGMPFPTGDVRVWQGFVMGNSGGGGTLWMEDRATYEARTPATRLPYGAILVHEVSHSYIGHESLTQFLELLQYNMARTGTPFLADWTFTRGWTPNADANTGVHALLDVYQLIGYDAMSFAYRAVWSMHPPYGQPLSAQAKQAFVDRAPDALEAQVAAKMEKVGI